MPRIIAGRWRGRRIDAPEGTAVRPTADRVREAWMSILHHDLPEARVLDLCAGTGALGLEALSRGAASCDFVDSTQRSLNTIRQNLAHLGGHEGVRLHRADALRYLDHVREGEFDIAFADPPYASGLARQLAERWHARRFAHIFAVEHAADDALPGDGDRRRYGTTAITIFR